VLHSGKESIPYPKVDPGGIAGRPDDDRRRGQGSIWRVSRLGARDNEVKIAGQRLMAERADRIDLGAERISSGKGLRVEDPPNRGDFVRSQRSGHPPRVVSHGQSACASVTRPRATMVSG
jgi:hypothetical protein